MTGPELIEDHRAQAPGICGVTEIGATGIEWICVSPVHAKVYQSRRRGPVLESNPGVDKHYMVRRWPNRPSPSEETS